MSPSHQRFFAGLWLAAAVFYVVFIARTGFTVAGELHFSLFDDGMISMRFARNLAEGFGLTWNPGEAPVEGYTNFLWTLYMALWHRLPVPGALVSLGLMGTGVAILLGLMAVVRAIAHRLSGGAFLPTAIATALVAFYYPLVFWTLRGMEVGALVLLVYGAVLLAFRLHERFRLGELVALAALLAMAVLTRLDAVIPHVLISGFLLLTLPAERRALAFGVLAASFLAPLGAHTAFRWAYYHEWLPNTYYLKVTGVSIADRLARGVKVLLQSYGYHLYPFLAPVPAALMARGADPRMLLLAAIVVCQAAYSVYVGGDAWEWIGGANRFLVVALPALAVLAGLGLAAILDAGRPATALRAAALVVAGALASRGLLALWPPAPAPASAAIWLAAGAAVAVGGWWLMPRLGSRLSVRVEGWPQAALALGCVLLLAVPANFRLVAQWATGNAIHAADDANASRLGYFLQATTAPDAVIAVTWAGAIPYFARRTTLDLLGKNDPLIAKGPPATPEFFPGHNKWNFAHSIGGQRPDVVVQYYESEANNRDMDRWGYDRLPNGMWVRRDSTRVDRARLGRNWQDPAVLADVLAGR